MDTPHDSAARKAFDEDLTLASRAHCPTLITGDRRDARETIARRLHLEGPFVGIDCARMDDRVFASQLEHVQGGTLFLDEIGDMSPQMQARLLGFLDAQASLRLRAPDRARMRAVRVIAATSRTLVDRVAADQFSADLFYRLNMIHLKIV